MLPSVIHPKIFRDFRTYVSLVSLTIGIIGLYHYYVSIQKRVPSYLVSPTRTRLVDSSVRAPKELQILYNDKPLNANVSAAVVYFWNQGKLPIKAEDVLEPLRIELDPVCEIIDARILKVNRDVTQFAKGEVSDSARNSLPFSFRILEKNDGAALQVTYKGRPDAAISVKGTIVGAGPPITLRESPDDVAKLDKEDALWRRWACTGVAAFSVIVFLGRKELDEKAGRFYSVGLVLLLILAVLITYTSITSTIEYQSIVPQTLLMDR